MPNALLPNVPFLDDNLPGLLIIKAVAMLDEILKEYMETNGIAPIKKFKDDLNGRIEYLQYMGKITNSDSLHDLRRTRNCLAHDSSEKITWESYDSGISEIHRALLNLKLVKKELGKFSCSAERSALDTEQTDETILGTFTYTITVFENERRAAKINWKENILNE
jgi:hypothetical protein